MMTKITKGIFEAFNMKGDFNELWQYMERIDAKHADGNTPWREAEIEYLIKQSRPLLKKLPVTKFNKMRRTKAMALLTRIEDGEHDFFVVDNFKDTIHNIWLHDLPNARGVEISDKVDKEFPEGAWDEDIYNESIDKNFFVSKNFPWDKDHSKKKYDIIERKREYFLAKFLEIHGGKKMRDRFWTFLHDIDEADRHGRMNVENIMMAQKAFDKGLIGGKQFSSYVKRAGEEALRWAYMGPETWKNDGDDTWQPLWDEAFYFKDLVKGRKIEQDCETTNCRESRDYPKKVLDKMAKGGGLDKWYCDEHVKDKPGNTFDVKK